MKHEQMKKFKITPKFQVDNLKEGEASNKKGNMEMNLRKMMS